MRWVTRENIKVDRVACPWLIKRFVDADAQLLDALYAYAQRRSSDDRAPGT